MLVISRLDDRPRKEEKPLTSEKDDSCSSKSVRLKQKKRTGRLMPGKNPQGESKRIPDVCFNFLEIT